MSTSPFSNATTQGLSDNQLVDIMFSSKFNYELVSNQFNIPTHEIKERIGALIQRRDAYLGKALLDRHITLDSITSLEYLSVLVKQTDSPAAKLVGEMSNNSSSRFTTTVEATCTAYTNTLNTLSQTTYNTDVEDSSRLGMYIAHYSPAKRSFDDAEIGKGAGAPRTLQRMSQRVLFRDGVSDSPSSAKKYKSRAYAPTFSPSSRLSQVSSSPLKPQPVNSAPPTPLARAFVNQNTDTDDDEEEEEEEEESSTPPPSTIINLEKTRTSAILKEETYEKIRSTLTANGFVVKDFFEAFKFFPTSAGKLQMTREEEIVNKKMQLQQRLEAFQIKPKCEIAGDGNCIFRAISDQMFGTSERHAEVRGRVSTWLHNNKHWVLDNEMILHQCVTGMTWEDYCAMIEKDKCWGDHLTLLAAAEKWGVVIAIVSSVDGNDFIAEINPIVKKTDEIFLLSQYAEHYYGSLSYAGPGTAHK